MNSELTLLTDRIVRLERHNRLLLRLVAGLLALMALGFLLGQDKVRQAHSEIWRSVRELEAKPVARVDVPLNLRGSE